MRCLSCRCGFPALVVPGVVLNVWTLRVPRNRIVKANVLERTIETAAQTSGEVPRILVLLDADDDCLGEVGPALLRRAQAVRRDREVRGVLAKSEFEASLLASVGSLAGQHGVAGNVNRPAGPESIRAAKGWLSHVMPHEPKSGASPDPPCRHSRSPEITEIWPNKGLTAHVGAVSSFDVDSRHRCCHFCNRPLPAVASRQAQAGVWWTSEDRDPKPPMTAASLWQIGESKTPSTSVRQCFQRVANESTGKRSE